MDSKPLTDSEETEEPGLRIVLVGRTGSGKSATGNTMLVRKAFRSMMSPSSVTSECQKETGEFEGQILSVVDTPGLFDTSKSLEEVKMEIIRCISMAAPGPHVFLVVIQPGRFTKEERDTVQIIQKIFGEKSSDYTMVLFTRGDALERSRCSVEDFISKDPSLHNFIQQCGGRYHVFNNWSEDPSQVQELLQKIHRMNYLNGGSYYTNEMLKEVEKVIREEKEKLLQENLQMKPEEARRKAERNNKLIELVGSSAGLGAALGTAVGAVVGPVGAAVGAVVGAALGLVLTGLIAVTEKKSCVIQ